MFRRYQALGSISVNFWANIWYCRFSLKNYISYQIFTKHKIWNFSEKCKKFELKSLHLKYIIVVKSTLWRQAFNPDSKSMKNFITSICLIVSMDAKDHHFMERSMFCKHYTPAGCMYITIWDRKEVTFFLRKKYNYLCKY